MAESLVEWLSARLDDDERRAKQANWESIRSAIHNSFDCLSADILFAAFNDPARVLAEVAAKRAILAEVQRRDAWLNMKTLVEPARSEATAMRDALVPVVRLLALPYADRPGYRDEWRPE